jgi:hypothetical protein
VRGALGREGEVHRRERGCVSNERDARSTAAAAALVKIKGS